MPIDKRVALNEIDHVLASYKDAEDRSDFDSANYDEVEINQIIVAASTAINRFAPIGSSYNEEMRRLDGQFEKEPFHLYRLSYLIGLLRELRRGIESDALDAFSDLVQAGVFKDFLEMAEYLLDEKYKDASAVLIGGVLEEHLRGLSRRRDIPITNENGRAKPVGTLNHELKKAGAYGSAHHKSVIAWYDIRTNVAHAHYGEYDADQVRAMLDGVRGFINRTLKS